MPAASGLDGRMRRCATGALLLVLPSCGEPAPEAATLGAVVRDSAGIEMVENRLPQLGAAVAFRLSPEPRVRIGAVEGAEGQRLLRVEDATLLPDGRLAVLDAGSAEVRVYGPGGEHLYSFGGSGDGPGEFGHPRQLAHLPPDTLMIWDGPTWRTSWFDLEGNVLREDAGRTKYGARLPEGWFAEGGRAVPGGGLLLRAYRRDEERETGRVYRPESAVLLLDRGPAGAVQRVGRLDASEQVRSAHRDWASSVSVPFGKRSAYDVGGRPTMIWTTDNQAFELGGHDATGDLVRIVRADAPPRPVTEADVAEWRRSVDRNVAELGLIERQREALYRVLERLLIPPAMPHLSALHVTRDGGVWARNFQPYGDESPRSYHVFDPKGAWRGLVRTPGGFEPLEIGEDYVIALVRDALDVEYVEVYELRRG